MNQIISKANNKIIALAAKTRCILACRKGEAYVDTGVKILIAVVIGALLLTSLYALFDDTLLPTLEDKITNLFNYEVSNSF